MSRFEACLAETLKHEGGYSNHPADTGGATMRGIIQRVYDAWREGQGLARRDVRLIEDSELRAIYYANYWQQVAGEALPQGIDLALWDFAVNSGPTRAISKIQEVLGLSVDGHMGPVTIQAVTAADKLETVKALCASRRRFVRQIKSYHVFGNGWNRRIDEIEAAACTMCMAPMVVSATPPGPLPVASDAQAESQGKATAVKPPMSTGSKVTAGATAGAAGVSMLPEVPKGIVATLTDAAAWQGMGKTAVAVAAFCWQSPAAMAVVFTVAIGVLWVPRLLGGAK